MSKVTVNKKLQSEISKKVDEMYLRELEFSQSRSAFQIEKFIGEDEYTDVTKYRHLSHNSYCLLVSLKKDLLECEKLKIKLENQNGKIKMAKSASDSQKRLFEIEKLELELTLQDIELSIDGKMKELAIFEKCIESLENKNGGPFTYKQFEEDQPEYWRKRFAGQMHEQVFGNRLGIGSGNYSSYIKALKDPIVDGSINTIDKLPIDNPAKLAVEYIDEKQKKILLQ